MFTLKEIPKGVSFLLQIIYITKYFICIYEYLIDIIELLWYIIFVTIIWGEKMGISYNKLWKQLIDKDMTKTELRLKADIGTATLAKLSKNEHVSMEVLLRICQVLSCDISEIMEIVIKENQNV